MRTLKNTKNNRPLPGSTQHHGSNNNIGMAQSKSFFTHRHGSTKSHTYATNAGLQITKDRVDETTNQRTESQMMHRCLIHTMSDAHAWLRPYFANLWNGAPAGRKQLAAFREANYAILRNAALGGLAGFTYSPYQENTIPMGYFKVTNGKLPYNGHLFQNGVNAVDGVTTDLFNVTQSGAEWYEVLSSIGLRPLDTLALVILIYSPGTNKMTLDLFEVKVLDHPNVVIGQQGSDDLVSVTPKVLANGWTITKDSGRIITLSLPKQARDISDSILLTCCFQVRKDGSRILCSDGYLWHWSDNVAGLTFPEALATYPGDNNVLNIPQHDDSDLYVDMGLPSGILWATRNIDLTQKNGFAASPFQYECSFFSWGNVDGHNPTSLTTFEYNWGGINAKEPWYEGQPYGDTPGSRLESDITLKEDAARVNLGTPWRMPSSNEIQELFDNCDFVKADGVTIIPPSTTDKRVTVNSVVGIYLKSKINGKLLFLATSGSGRNNDWINRGSFGVYLSTSFYSSRRAICLSFYPSTVNPHDNINRYSGLVIRPVYIRGRGKSQPEAKDPEAPTSR